jgi:hypothetical protein
LAVFDFVTSALLILICALYWLAGRRLGFRDGLEKGLRDGSEKGYREGFANGLRWIEDRVVVFDDLKSVRKQYLQFCSEMIELSHSALGIQSSLEKLVDEPKDNRSGNDAENSEDSAVQSADLTAANVPNEDYRYDEALMVGRERKESPRGIAGAVMLAGVMCLCASAAWANDGVGITGPEAVPAPGFPCTLFLQGELPEGTEIGWDVKPRREGVRMIRPSKDGRSADLTTLASLRDGWQITTAIHEPGKPIYFRSYVVFVPGQPYTPPPTPSPPVPGPPQPPGPPIPPGPAPAPEPSFPNERFGVSTKTLNLVSAIKSENRAGEILCLLSGCKDLLEQIKEKKLTGPVSIIKAMGALLDRCTTAPWDPPREQLANKIQELYQQGRLQSDSDWSDLATELQDGLKAVPAK